MLISCNKLKSYIKDSNKIDWLKVWDNFTIRTAEIENVKEVGNTFDNVVVAEIKECIKHPNSDHMHILKVNNGDEDIQIVCGAPNVRVGLKTALIKVGGHIDGIEITPKELRGVISYGMCCSFKELGIGEDHEGIIELPSDAPVGMDIKKYLPIEDIIVEIDNKSLTNRPDLWGHYGIAREICAITGHKLLPLEVEEIKNDKDDLDIKIKNKDLCYRYCGLKIENLTNHKTPIDMQVFLNYVGLRSISLLVDVTNYLALELGQPMHAFDGNIVKNIEVDNACDNDKFVTLDGEERKLSKEMLMIKANGKYSAIAGVMGGLDSEIKENTDKIFLESATFDAGSVRKTAVKLGLRTEASARYEKSLDPNMTDLAIKRVVYLLRKENPNMKIVSNLTDVYPTKVNEGHITLRKSLLNVYLGKEITDKTVVDILSSLDFKVEVNKDSYEVTVPTYRHTKDVFIMQDLIEEIARIYGLEKFEPKPLRLDLNAVEHETIYNEEYEIKHLLAEKYDMHEVHSYLWYDSSLLNELHIKKNGIKLLGKKENNILRDDLSLSLMYIVKNNFKYYKNFNIFEIGTIIKDNQNKKVLSIILASEEKELESIYNKAKSIVCYLFKYLKNKDVEIVKNLNIKEYYDKSLSKNILINNNVIGELNVLEKSITNILAKKKVIITIDIDFDMLYKIKKTKQFAIQVSKYPIVELDYTIIMNNQKYQDLKDILNKFKNNLIKDWYLVNTYENKYTIKYILGSMSKTLEAKELENFKEQIIYYIKSNGFNIIE